MSQETGKTQPNNPGDEKNNQLLREGIAAAKLGDKETARSKLRELVAKDQYSEMGWFWLASVVETDEEKQTCLGNVVVINPNNARAQQLLNQLSEASLGLSGPVLDVPSSSGVGRLQGRAVLIIGGIVVIGVLLILLAISGQSTPPEPTVISAVSTSTPIVVATQAGTAAADAPTITPTLALVPPTLPPTWTPQPETGSSGGVTPLPPPPPGLTGRLVAIHGSPNNGIQNFPIITMDPYGGSIHEMPPGELGDYAMMTPDGARLIYDYYDVTLYAQALRVLNASGSKALDVPALWDNQPPLVRVQMTSLARNGEALVFSALSPTEGTNPSIYVLPVKLPPPNANAANDTSKTLGDGLATQPAEQNPLPPAPGAAGSGQKVFRLTPPDSGINVWPALSPDGSHVAFVRDTKPTGQDGVDIYVISAQGTELTNLSSDGVTNIEAAPAYSPDGQRIAFQAAAAGSKNNDIYIINTNGLNKVKVTGGEGDNIRPHWSPDGKFLAFSSTRSGKWEVYIADVDAKKIYQATSTQQSTVCTDWSAK